MNQYYRHLWPRNHKSDSKIPTLIDTIDLVDEVLVYYSASKIFPRRVRGKGQQRKCIEHMREMNLLSSISSI